VQKAQRRAAIGTSLRHSGHFFVVGYNEEVHGCANQEKRHHRVNVEDAWKLFDIAAAQPRSGVRM